MNRFLVALVLALAAPLARADGTFSAIRVAKGYSGPVELNVVWSNGSDRDVSACTGTMKVSQVTPPVERFTQKLRGSGASHLVAVVSAADTAVPGTYRVEITVQDQARVDTWQGDLVVEP